MISACLLWALFIILSFYFCEYILCEIPIVLIGTLTLTIDYIVTLQKQKSTLSINDATFVNTSTIDHHQLLINHSLASCPASKNIYSNSVKSSQLVWVISFRMPPRQDVDRCAILECERGERVNIVGTGFLALSGILHATWIPFIPSPQYIGHCRMCHIKLTNWASCKLSLHYWCLLYNSFEIMFSCFKTYGVHVSIDVA